MKLIDYSLDEIKKAVQESSQNYDYSVFYPDSILKLNREISFLEKDILKAIDKEDQNLKMIRQAYTHFKREYGKFLHFKEKAYQFVYNSDENFKLFNLIEKLTKNKVISTLDKKERRMYSNSFRPLINMDIILSEENFRNILRQLNINFSRDYRIIFTKFDISTLFKQNERLLKKKYPNLNYKPIAELDELSLYPDGQLYENDRLIHDIDKHQGGMYEFVKYLMDKQNRLENQDILQITLPGKFKNSLPSLYNNTNTRMREGDSKYRIRKNRGKETIYIGYSNKWKEEFIEKHYGENA